MSDEVGVVISLAEAYSHLEQIKALDLSVTSTFLIENKTRLLKDGLCFTDNSDKLVTFPSLLYPKKHFISETEFKEINRERIFQFKLQTTDLLRAVHEANWLDRYLEFLRTYSEKTGDAHFYFNADAVYSIQSSIEKVRNLDARSGGLSDCIEAAYTLYEANHFPGYRTLREFCEEFPPPDPLADIKAFETYFHQYNANDYLYELAHTCSNSGSSFQNAFVKSVDNALGLGDNNVLDSSRAIKGFRFRNKILSDFSFNPFGHSPSFHWVSYGNEPFTLTNDQANIVKVLYENYRLNNNSFLSQKEIASKLNEIDPSVIVDSFRLEDKFRVKGSGRVLKPVFHRLIMKNDDGSKGNYYRLSLPARTAQITRATG